MKPFLTLAVMLVAVSLASAAKVPATEGASDVPKAPQPLIEVVLISDGETWVEVKGVLSPYKFDGAKRIKLSPGDYEVVGRRKWFRDVEKTVKVRDGLPSPTLSVVCTISLQQK